MTTFSDAAAYYDEVFDDRVYRAEDLAVKRLVHRWIDQHEVLDVGCGTGLALTMGRPTAYLGIDACPLMIQRARERWLPEPGRERPTLDGAPRFRVCPAENAPPWRSAFHTITCLWAYPYLSDQAGLLAKWFTALKPGGNLILVSWDESYSPTLDVPFLAPPMRLVCAVAEEFGFVAWPLAGLRGREAGRWIARALPLPLAARVLQRSAEAPGAWILRLEKPILMTYHPPAPQASRRLRPHAA